jgi:hypothetical protein
MLQRRRGGHEAGELRKDRLNQETDEVEEEKVDRKTRVKIHRPECSEALRCRGRAWCWDVFLYVVNSPLMYQLWFVCTACIGGTNMNNSILVCER